MNHVNKEKRHDITAVFIFLLLSMFAVLSLTLVLFSAQAYRNTVDRGNVHNNERILSSFIRNNLRSADAEGCITVAEMDSIPCLLITDPNEIGEYVKYIYVSNGYLHELYVETSSKFDAESGEKICQADRMEARIEEEMVLVNIYQDEKVFETAFLTRCGEGRL